VSKGFGGKFGVQKDRQDKTSVGYDHQTELSKHNSQTDGAKGFGGKFGVQQGSQDKNAVGYDHQTELSKHNSQTDGAKGFGGKFGVDKTKQDKAAQGYNDGGGPVAGYKTAIDVKGDVKNFRSRFENFGASQEEETRKKLEAEKEKRRKDDEKRKIDEKKREEERDRQFESERKEKEDKIAESRRREEEIAEERRGKEEESRLKREEERRIMEEQSAEQSMVEDRRKQEEERKRRDEEDEKRRKEDDKRRGEEAEARRRKQSEDSREAERIIREEERVAHEKKMAEDQKRAEERKTEKRRVEEERKAEADRKIQEEEELAKKTAALSVSVSGKSATAVFDYTAGDGDEISFSQGDIIGNVEQPDEGWWVGEISGKKGMFPASYVTLNEDVAAEPVKPKRQSSNLGPTDEGMCGVALYSYTAADTDELTFDEGERITNVEKPDKGWWLGVCRGRKGIFPASYITISGSEPPQNVGQCGQALYSYDAADVDELTLVEGGRVTNIEMIDEGWWMGQCNGGKGIFPASYVQLEE